MILRHDTARLNKAVRGGAASATVPMLCSVMGCDDKGMDLDERHGHGMPLLVWS